MAQFRGILAEVDSNLTEEDLDGIIAEIDEDGSGTMDFDEFCEMMMTTAEDEWGSSSSGSNQPLKHINITTNDFRALNLLSFPRWLKNLRRSILFLFYFKYTILLEKFIFHAFCWNM